MVMASLVQSGGGAGDGRKGVREEGVMVRT